MKLYTEEQVNKIASQVKDNGYWNDFEITPIELPSDEEIEKQSIGNATFAPSFISGAKWVREQITKTK